MKLGAPASSLNMVVYKQAQQRSNTTEIDLQRRSKRIGSTPTEKSTEPGQSDLAQQKSMRILDRRRSDSQPTRRQSSVRLTQISGCGQAIKGISHSSEDVWFLCRCWPRDFVGWRAVERQRAPVNSHHCWGLADARTQPPGSSGVSPVLRTARTLQEERCGKVDHPQGLPKER